MNIRFQVGGASHWKADIVITFLFKNEKADSLSHMISEVPWLSLAPAWRDWKGNEKESAVLYGPPAMEIPRVLVIGLGTPEKLSMVKFRHATGLAIRKCREMGLSGVGLDTVSVEKIGMSLNKNVSEMVREAVFSSLASLYSFDKWKSEKNNTSDIENLFILVNGEYAEDTLRIAVRRGEAEATGIYLARDLANEPANAMTPAILAEKAREVAVHRGMKYQSLGEDELKSEGMNAFLAVSKGSDEEARMAVLEYTPKGTEQEKPIILVGKGICFDSGGISLKPSKGMEEMKGDMSGAAAVLGVMEALGVLSTSITLKRPVVAVMACSENMPGGHATRPGDIVRAKNGKSIEIVNTDAEGRLILADALCWAQVAYEPKYLIDIATLTGACAVALGKDSAGLFSNDDNLGLAMFNLGNDLGERNWRMPLWDELTEKVLTSNIADMKNSGEREGGAVSAAGFLKNFVKENVSWAHLDIAAADVSESPINAKGATGFGVRTLLAVVLDMQEN